MRIAILRLTGAAPQVIHERWIVRSETFEGLLDIAYAMNRAVAFRALAQLPWSLCASEEEHCKHSEVGIT